MAGYLPTFVPARHPGEAKVGLNQRRCLLTLSGDISYSCC